MWEAIIKDGYPGDKCLEKYIELAKKEKYIELAKKEKQKREKDHLIVCTYRNCDLHYFIDAISGKQISKQEYAKRYKAAFGKENERLDYIFTEPSF